MRRRQTRSISRSLRYRAQSRFSSSCSSSSSPSAIVAARPRRAATLPPLIQHEFEIGWTTATLFAFLMLFWWAGSNQIYQLLPPAQAMEIHVVAKQWMWKIEHPNGVREINMLHAPIDEPIRLDMTSQDVIHSFSVPDFRIKQDILPGRYVESWFRATKTGTFHLYCTQFCGTAHSGMVGSVIIMSKPDFASWLASAASRRRSRGTGPRAVHEPWLRRLPHAWRAQSTRPTSRASTGGKFPLSDGGSRWSTTPISAIGSSIRRAIPPAGYDPDHALVQGRGRRRADFRPHRLHPFAGPEPRSASMTDAVAPIDQPIRAARVSPLAAISIRRAEG